MVNYFSCHISFRMAPPSTSSSFCQRELCRIGLKTFSHQTLSPAGLVGTGDGKLCRIYLTEVTAPCFLCRHQKSSVHYYKLYVRPHCCTLCKHTRLFLLAVETNAFICTPLLCKKVSHEFGEREQAGKLMASTRLWGWLWKQQCHVSRHVFPSPLWMKLLSMSSRFIAVF